MPSRFDFPVGVLGGTAAVVLYTLDYFIGPEYTERSDIIGFLQNVAQMFLFLSLAYAVVRIAIVLTDERKKNPRRSRRSNRPSSNLVPKPSAPPAPENVKVMVPEKRGPNGPLAKNRVPNVVRSAP